MTEPRPSTEKDAPHHPECRQQDGHYVCDPRCPGPHGGERCGYVAPSGDCGHGHLTDEAAQECAERAAAYVIPSAKGGAE